VPYQQKPTRYQYRLTDKGAALYPIALQLHEWAGRWLLEGEQANIALRHKPCNASLQTELVCSACNESLNAHNVSFDPDYTIGT